MNKYFNVLLINHLHFPYVIIYISVFYDYQILNVFQTVVSSSYFMAYHTILKTSKDYYSALEWARKISDNISLSINEGREGDPIKVFPYR